MLSRGAFQPQWFYDAMTLSFKILVLFQSAAAHNPSELVRHSVFLLCGERMGEDNVESLKAKPDKFWEETDTAQSESKMTVKRKFFK